MWYYWWYWVLSNRHECCHPCPQEHIFGREKLLVRRASYSTTLKNSFTLFWPFFMESSDFQLCFWFSSTSILSDSKPAARTAVHLERVHLEGSLSENLPDYCEPQQKTSHATTTPAPDDSPYILSICEYLLLISPTRLQVTPLANKSTSPVLNLILSSQMCATLHAPQFLDSKRRRAELRKGFISQDLGTY